MSTFAFSKKMRSTFTSALCLLVTFVSHAEESITIGKKEYFLAYTEKDEKIGSLREFVPEGETLQDWVTLVAVRHFYKTKSPKKYVERMAAEYRKRLPYMEFAIMQDPDSENWMIDYILYPPQEDKGYVEWNYFKAMPNPNEKGILVGQFVRRHPLDGSLQKVFDKWNISDYRREMLDILLSHEFEIME